MSRILLLALALLPFPLAAQERPSSEEQMRQKLASAFLRNTDWVRELPIAMDRAKVRKQLIFGYFTTAGP